MEELFVSVICIWCGGRPVFRVLSPLLKPFRLFFYACYYTDFQLFLMSFKVYNAVKDNITKDLNPVAT